MNKLKDHIYVVPEDDADRQIANGFVDHHMVDDRRIQVMPPPGGWTNVLKVFEREYIRELRNNNCAHVVLLIDFDNLVEERKSRFEQAIPEDLKDRVFVVGSKENPEALKRLLRATFEQIGVTLAAECDSGSIGYWDCEQLRHNDEERQRLALKFKTILAWGGP